VVRFLPKRAAAMLFAGVDSSAVDPAEGRSLENPRRGSRWFPARKLSVAKMVASEKAT